MKPDTIPYMGTDITIEDYHDREMEGFSKTLLDQVHKSIAHYLYYVSTPNEPTPAMILGSAVHTKILEPHLFDREFMVLPPGDGRTKAVREAKAEAEDRGLKVLTSANMETVMGMYKAFNVHPTAPNIIEEGQAETSLFWEDEETGLLVKARPDWMRIEDGKADVSDLKTCRDARPDGFERTIYNFRYHVQAAMIADGLKANGIEMENFLLIAIESSPPYNPLVYRLMDDAIDLGRKAYKADLKKIKEWVDGPNIYDGYGIEIIEVGLPVWAQRKEESIYD